MLYRFVISLNILFLCLTGSTTGFSQSNKKPTYDTIQICHDLYDHASKVFQRDFDSTLLILNQAIPCYLSFEDWGNYIKCLNGITSVYFYQNKFTEFNKYTFYTYEETKRYFDDTHPRYANAVNNLSTYYFKIGDYDKAIKLAFESLRIKEKNEEPKIELAISYQNLANYNKLNGDYSKALKFMTKSLEFTLDSLDERSHRVAELYDGLALIYQRAEQIDSALVYHNKSLTILEKLFTAEKNRTNNLTIESIHWLAELWIKKGDYNLARYYIQKALALQKENTSYRKFDSYELLSQVFIKEKKYEKALAALLKAEGLATNYSNRNTPPFIARRNERFAQVYDFIGNNDKALSKYQDALMVLSPGFDANGLDNPASESIFDRQDALSILEGKANLLLKLSKANDNFNYLTASFDTYLTAIDLVRDIRQGIQTIESKNTLSEKTVSVYEGAIRIAFDLYEQTKEEKYKTKAFELAESNKALLLLESINEQSAKGFVGIPDSLLEQEKEIKLNLAYLQKLRLESETEAVKTIEDQIFELEQDLDRLTTSFEKNYPRYYELKYRNEPVELKIIQSELSKSNNALLEYFVGEEAIYLFIVTSEFIDIQVIEEPAMVFSTINQLRTVLNHPPGSADAQTEFIQYTTASHTLYSMLLQSALESLPDHITGLTIIPDYQLNYVPFEVLLSKATDPEQPSYAIENLDYLLEDFTVNYHYSATLLHKSQQRQKPAYEYDFIGFAPSFKEANTTASRACTADELYSLQCSGEEVSTISDLLNGTARIGDEAIKSNFEKEAGAYRILHMATHACVDEDNANFNKIFLTDDFLSNFDLYNLELSAELAVLSACNTGSGELVKGEGVMSLARGFINAGCSSTLMSIWSVDDCATSDIMLRFYEGLKKGLKKDEALRTAKLNYLDSVSKTKKHPYYWAAFVQFGDVKVMDFKSSVRWLLWFGGFILLVGLGYLLRRKT